jgi:hypothetical protein
VAAEALAIERGVATEQIPAAEGLALYAAAFNGMPDPVLHLAARAMGVVTGLAALEPDPRAPGADVLLDAALSAPRPCVNRRASSLRRVGPPAADQPPVPAQQRVRRHQPVHPRRLGEQAGQDSEHGPGRPSSASA